MSDKTCKAIRTNLMRAGVEEHRITGDVVDKVLAYAAWDKSAAARAQARPHPGESEQS